MKKILYIGNKLESKKSNVSSITILGKLLENEGYVMYYASSKINKIIRLLDMLCACVVYRKRIDFVIIDTYSTWNFYYAFFVSQLCRLLSLRYLLKLNGGNLPFRLKNNPRLSEMIFDHAYKMISPSPYLKKAFKVHGYAHVIHVPNAINIDTYPAIERSYENIRLLWVRSFSEIYNPKLAVKVLKALLDDGCQASLCMVGPDADGSLVEVKALARKLHVEVKFTGKLTKPEWIALSKDYNIFINTTNFDNMPVSVIEVMALGLPVISTNVGGMPFLIENEVDGLLIAPNSVDAFVDAIKTIINKPDKAIEMTYKARQKVEQFDWAIVKKQWDNVLQ